MFDTYRLFYHVQVNLLLTSKERESEKGKEVLNSSNVQKVKKEKQKSKIISAQERIVSDAS